MKRGSSLLPTRPDWWPRTKAAPGNTGRADCRQRDVLVSPGGCAPVLAHLASFGRNPGGSPDFLAYPVPKACMHVLGTGGLRRLGVARSASSPKAAQALGCSLTPGLRISFGRVTCMARAASVPGLWTLGFLLLCGACVWVWIVVGLGSQLRPATPGLGVGVCVCLRARSACTPPLLAGVCGVGLCAWARVSAAPRHSWLRCWGLCVFVCALCLYPATPGWGVRCGCVCLGSGFGCAPPLLAGMLGPVCACVAAPLVPRHSWLGCAVWVCVLGLGFRLRPATPGWGVGVCACLCAHSACPPSLVVGVCGVGVCAWAQVAAEPHHSWPGCWAVCVLLCALCCYPATPGWGVRCGCVCLGSGFGCASPLPAWVFGCVCVCVRTPLVPCHSWLGCAVWVCVLGLGVRLRPATPGWGVGVCVFVCAHRLYTATPGTGVRCGCVCLSSGFHCAPLLLAGVLGCVCVFVCLLCLYPANPGWGVWCVCVFVCAHRLYPANPCWGAWCGWVCLGSGFRCAPPLLAGVLGCVCVFVCLLRLYPAIPAWGMWCGCVWLGSGFGCAPPHLAGVSGCVCACVRSPLVPRHSWLGCAVWACVFVLGVWLLPAFPGLGVGVCVFVCALRLYPAHSGWGARRGCVCLGSGFSCAPPLLAGVLGCVCACVRALLVPRQSWLGCAVWVCLLGLRFGLRPATPGWGVGVCVCVFVLALLVPSQSWLGSVLRVYVLGLGFRLRPATPGWGVGVCVCLCALSACTPTLLAGFSGVWVWCCMAPVPVPWFVPCCECCPDLRHPVAVLAWHLSVCLGRGGRRASLACLVAPLWCAAPGPVWSLSVLRSAFLTPWCRSPPRGLEPPALLGGCAGLAEAGREPGSLCLPLTRAVAAALGSPWFVPVWGPAIGFSLAGPSGVGLGLLALRWLACVDPITDASGFPYRLSVDGGLGRCTGALSCGRGHRPFWVGGRHARVPCVCACVCPSWPGRAGRSPGALWCTSPFPVAGLAALFVCSALPRLGSPFFLFVRPGCLRPSLFTGPGLPALGVLPPPPFFFCPPPFFFPLCARVVSGVSCFPARRAFGLVAFLSPPPFFLLLFLAPFFPPPLAFFCFFFFVRPRCLLRSVFSGPGCLRPKQLLSPPPPPFSFCFFSCFSSIFLFSSSPGSFFFLPRCPWRSVCSGPGCLGPWRLVVAPAPPPVVFSFLFFFLIFFPCLCLASGAQRGRCVCPGLWGVLVCASVVLSLSLLFEQCSPAPLALAGVVWCCPSCLGVCCWAWPSSVASRWVLVSCFGGAVPVWPRGSPPCGLVWCVLVLRCPVLCSVALCCRVVVCCRALLFVCVVACACCLFPAAGRLLCVFWGPMLCAPCSLRPVRCCAALCWYPCVVLSA